MTTRFDLDGITIDRIVEQEAPLFDPLQFFPTLSREMLDANRAWLGPRAIDPATGKLIFCIQSYLVRTPHHTILVDSCVGNHKPRPSRAFWDMMDSDRYQKNLAAAGVTVGDIDFVMCTHLHVDHVGWNTRLDNGRWVPTFPNAKYIFADRELTYWTERHKTDPAPVPWIQDSVLPIVEAGRAERVKSDHSLNESVRLIPSPGHTIDHYCVHVGQEGHDALIAGDAVHCAIQVRHPELGMMSDYDQALSGDTRRKLFSRFADTPTLICTGHFPSPSAGRIVRRGEAYDFSFV
jgi:glyoxylase-like metal-dependent hydrolase (beta-lactamase superfamily II)